MASLLLRRTAAVCTRPIGVRWQSTAVSVPTAFNRAVKLTQRSRAARLPDSREYDYIRNEVAARVLDRFEDITRTFPVAVDVGANTANILQQLDGHGGITKLHMIESCRDMLYRDQAAWAAKAGVEVVPLVQDEEAPWAIDTGSVDAVMSSCSMHWMNNLPHVMSEARRVLKPDSPFMGAMLGGETLMELRSSFVMAEMEVSSGVSPHVSPMVQMSDVGDLLSSAGFAMPTVDSDSFTCEYPSAKSLMRHLQSMGESNACVLMRPGVFKRVLQRASEIYEAEYANPDGSITATFNVIYFIGWTPSPAQPKALRRGSVPKGFGARGSGPPPELAEGGTGSSGGAGGGGAGACGVPTPMA